jgi:hypothetical protein
VASKTGSTPTPRALPQEPQAASSTRGKEKRFFGVFLGREKKKVKKRNGQLCNIAMDVTMDDERVWRSHG